MAEVPQQPTSMFNMQLSAESPQTPNYGYEEEMYDERKRKDGEYGEYNPQNMYGEETQAPSMDMESDYGDESDDYEDENFDYGQRNDEYAQQYRENVNMSNFGYSPDIIGGDLINYDTPYANNDFQDREIIDNGGRPYGDWYNLNNLLGDMKAPKGASKSEMNDLVGFGINDMSDIIGLSQDKVGGDSFNKMFGFDSMSEAVGISNERVGQASFDDLFGFGGVNPSGTIGRGDEYDPQTMFGFMDGLKKVGGAFKKAGGAIAGGAKAVYNSKASQFMRNKASEAVAQHQANKLAKQNLKEEVYKRLADAGTNPYEKKGLFSGGSKGGDDGDGSKKPTTTYSFVPSTDSPLKGLGFGDKDAVEADIFGFNKMTKDSEDGGYGNADVFGFSSMRDNEVGETDTFGFQAMSENEAPTSQSQFGFKMGTENDAPQSAKDVFGVDVGGGIGNAPATFSDTFGFKHESENPQSITDVFGIHVDEHLNKNTYMNGVSKAMGEDVPDVRANLATMQTASPQKTVYKTNYKPSTRQRAPVKMNYEFPQGNVPMQSQEVVDPQCHEGAYNRIGKMLGNNQEYASNFENYGYSLDVGGMFSGNDNDQLIGFNPDIIGIGFNNDDSSPVLARPSNKSSRKVRVTTYKVEGGKVTKRSTKVNGKSVEKKKSTKSSSKGGKKKTTKKSSGTKSKNTKVKNTKSKSNSQDDFIKELIWG